MKLKCLNCKFEYPPQMIKIDKTIAPTINNTLVINENINNKDTTQVAYKIMEMVDLIFYNKNWYKYDTDTGLYILYYKEQIINLIDKLGKDFEDEEFSGWINKISYKETLLRELEAKCFKVIDFDNNPNLLGFKNGVYDLQTNTFRKATKNEFITMTCKYNYISNYNTSLAFEYLSNIFPIKEELDYAINRLSLILEGVNREQTVTFNYGFTASNGKSYLMERVKSALGDYSDSFSVNLLTNKMKGAGEANSTLINFKNKRFLYCYLSSKIEILFSRQ